MELLKHVPSFSASEAALLARERYGIRAMARPLPSERDQNFLLETGSGERFVLKIANALEDRALLEAQQQAMARVSAAQSAALCPQVLPLRNTDGGTIAEATSRSGSHHLIWLVSYISGVPLGNLRWHSPELLHDLGRAMGELDRALASFDHPAIHRDFHWDLANGPRIFQEFESCIADLQSRELAGRAALLFERHCAPLLAGLRKSAIHNDANDFNVLVAGKPPHRRIAGLVDFGDMVHSYTAGDLAVAMAYAMLGKPAPLAAAAHIVRGYHAVWPLQENEIAALWGLACLRLCMSLCLAGRQRAQRPEDDYLSISQEPIRQTLPKLLQIHPHFAEAAFRHACDLSPVRSSHAVAHWLRANSETFAPVMLPDLRRAPCVVFDLSAGSPLISGEARENSEPELTRKLFGVMAAAGVKIGVGRYDEPRLIYVSPIFATGSGPMEERRVIHLGIDLFAKAGAPVYAPLAGVVHGFANNRAPQDYGPVIVLRHTTGDGHTFYTLYGHLSAASLEGWSVGQAVAQGQPLATLGAPEVNGGWTPHLHFQIITDMLGMESDFPGVGCAGEREIWRSLSPDPNLILGIPAQRFPCATPKAETLAARRRRIGRNLSLAYAEPLKIVRGWMQYLYDENGRKFIDAYNNVPHVGHCHPRVVKAGRDAMAVLNTNTRYLHDAILQYAEQLCATLPDPLSVCFFVNSGSEANELALRLARAHTRRRDLIVLESAYHGHTTTLIDISPYKHQGAGGTGAPPWVHAVPVPDTYRGAHRAHDLQANALQANALQANGLLAGKKYAEYVATAIEEIRRQGGGLAGYIAESLPSVGGQIVFPPGYLSAVYAAVREAGGVCIADEVQTGFGRTGAHFWGFEAQRVVPDIVVLGKPMGNGHPIGAVVTTEEIATSFDNGMEFFSTFGGNTVSCAVGLEVLRVVLEEKLQAHAMRVGDRLLRGLRPLQEKYEMVGDVRGSGLFLGVELVTDRKTLAPAAQEASLISNFMRDQGVLLGTDGPHHNVIKIRPPMPFAEEDADYLLGALEMALQEIS